MREALKRDTFNLRIKQGRTNFKRYFKFKYRRHDFESWWWVLTDTLKNRTEEDLKYK